MKIVRIIARLNVGGPAKHVVWLTEGLRAPDCKTLLVAGSVPSGEEDMGYFAAQHDVQPIFLTEMSREVSLKDALTVWKLYRLLLREKPDVVHTHTAKAGTVGRLAGFFYRWLTHGVLVGRPRQCRFVHTYHGHIFHGYYGRLKTKLFLAIEKALAQIITDRIVVVSEQQRKEIHETFGVGRTNQFEVIPLGLDLSPFAKAEERRELFRSELGVKQDQLLVGIIGRLTEIKNHDLFLRAVAVLKQQEIKPKLRFVVIGDGNLSRELKEEAQRLGVVGDVVFAGNRKDPEVFYPALDIVALTSNNEGTPLTLIEAMANSRAIIATLVGGVVDLLGQEICGGQDCSYRICERGIGVMPQDPEAFAAGIRLLVADQPLRTQLGKRGLAYVTQRHSKDRLLSDIRSLYVRMLHESTVAKTESADRLESRV